MMGKRNTQHTKRKYLCWHYNNNENNNNNNNYSNNIITCNGIRPTTLAGIKKIGENKKKKQQPSRNQFSGNVNEKKKKKI